MKNPSILEGGIARAFSAIRKLFTRQSGSDELIAWVPESDRQLTTKYITQNGVYRASDDGYYAYSSVTVNVSTTDSVTGKDPVTGEDVVVKPDPQTGELVETVVPSSIEVVTPPTFTGPYGDGAYISFEGIEVKAYLASGEVWEDADHPGGVIPNSELTFPVTVTEYSDVYSYSEVTTDLNVTPLPSTFNFIVGNGYGTGAEPEYICSQPVFITTGMNVTSEETHLFICATGSSTPFTLYRTATGQTENARQTTINGKTVYYSGLYGSTIPSTYPLPMNTIEGWTEAPGFGNIAYAMVYGDTIAGGNQQVPVEWQRPGDGAVLDDAFGIYVVDITPGGHGED